MRARTSKPFDLSNERFGKDGNYRWFLVRSILFADDQGHIIRCMPLGQISGSQAGEERMRDENLALREAKSIRHSC